MENFSSVTTWAKRFLEVDVSTSESSIGIPRQIETATAYEHYRKWCAAGSQMLFSRYTFSRRLRANGYNLGFGKDPCSGKSIRVIEYVKWVEQPGASVVKPDPEGGGE